MKNQETVQPVQPVMEAEVTQKLTEEEFGKMTVLNQEFMNITMDLGALEVQKMAIEKRRAQLEEFHAEKMRESEEFTTTLRERYGDINININTGEFVKMESPE